MSDQEKNKKILLDKFLLGKITRDERHELDKYALDDPFLFDAMQGFTEVKADHHQDIEKLKSKKLTSESKKRRSLIPFTIAASFLILVAATFWTLSPKEMNSKTFAEAEISTKDMQADEKMMEDVVLEESEPSERMQTATNEIKTSPTVLKKKKALEASTPEAPAIQKSKESNVFAEAEGRAEEVIAAPAPIMEDEAIVNTSRVDHSEEKFADGFVSKNEEVAEAESVELEVSDIVLEEEADQLNANAPAEAKRAKSARANATDYYVDGIAVKDWQYELVLIEAFEKNFSKKEIRRLKKEVELEFDLEQGVIKNFRSIPAQSADIDQKLFDIINDVRSYFPSNVNGYRLPLTFL